MRALALSLCVAATVAGCGGSSAGPRSLPAVTSSPTPSASPSPVAVDVPVAARAADSRGAEAFARFFYAQIVHAFAVKDPEIVRALSSPRCEGCARFIASITKLRDQRERAENLEFRIESAVAPAVMDNSVRVDVTWSAPKVAIRYDAQGRELSRSGPFRRVDDELTLARRGGNWVVTDMTSVRRFK